MNQTIHTAMGAAVCTRYDQVERDDRDGICVAVLSAYKGMFIGPCGRPAVIRREAPTV